MVEMKRVVKCASCGHPVQMMFEKLLKEIKWKCEKCGSKNLAIRRK